MNDWDIFFKVVDFEDEEPEEETFELPEGAAPCSFSGDDYGFYGTGADGVLTLFGVRNRDERRSYKIPEGVVRIAGGAFAGQEYLEEVSLPASLTEIPDGVFANSTGWAGEYGGIRKVNTAPGNGRFFSDENGFYELLPDGRKRLVLWYLDGEALIGADVAAAAPKAFYGRKTTKVRFADCGYTYTFPAHAFFREELLKGFGKDGVLYDFSVYDNFLLLNHFNPERLRMLCDRLTQPLRLSEDMRAQLLSHVRERMTYVVEALVKANAIPELCYMLETEIFTKEAAAEAIELLNQTESREMLTYLMDYQNTHFQREEFDFSI